MSRQPHPGVHARTCTRAHPDTYAYAYPDSDAYYDAGAFRSSGHRSARTGPSGVTTAAV